MKILFATIFFFALVSLVAAAVPGNLRQTGSGWPACAPTQKQYSGYFDINVTTSKHYFYWMIESKVQSNKIILWLSGGPGCSSMLSLLGETGPCHINETTGELYQNPYAWTNEAHVIWLDQPAGVGYSYSGAGGADSDEKEVGHDNNAFFQHFFAAYPHMKDYELTVVGESYGGHYAPTTASAIYKANNDGTNDIKVNLVALATGNGLVAPVVQYPYYEPMATTGCEEARADHQPCVSKFVADLMNLSIGSCVKACTECDEGNDEACTLGSEVCNQQISAYSDTGLNPYDVTQQCEYPPLCYRFTQMTSFLNEAAVKNSLGVPSSVNWQTCNYTVNGMFQSAGDWLHRFDLLIPPLLEAGIRYLNYAGDYDFICNWMGNQAVALDLPWSGKSDFNAAPFNEWTVDGQTVGWVRTVASSNSPIHMSFVKVHKAGHMVPMNQPKSASMMINAFINNQKFIPSQ